jgi:GTP-binding protein YchF
LKIGLVGLSNSGKTTVFNALTGQNLETTIYLTTSGNPNLAVVKVPDARLDKLSEIFKPKKTTHATIEYIDYLGLTKGDPMQNRKVFDLIKDMDAIVDVVRVFEDDSVIHPIGKIDPLRDIETVELELIFGDLELIDKRLDRMEQALKRSRKPDDSEKKLLLKCKEFLDKGLALRDVEFGEEDYRAMKPLQFLSIKPEIIVLNIGENELNTNYTKELENIINKRYPLIQILTMCGKIEMEIAQLSPDDAKLFLDDLGIDNSASNRLIRICYDLLGLVTFFTTVGDEVRAWSITKGTNAHKAAGKVHSDIERGFIKAEVISFDDFISARNIQSAREKGLLRLEGKSYEVKDGDIINFRFHV